MESKVNYVLVGIFVVVLGTALVAGVLWLTAGIERGQYQTYVVYPQESVAGLNAGAVVNYNGVPVGQVTEVGLDPDNPERVRLLLQIKQGTPIKVDTVALLDVALLTGVATIDLVGSTPAAPVLRAKPGERYPVIKSEPSFAGRFEQVLAGLADNLKEVTDNLRDLLSVDNRRAVHEILARLQELTATLVVLSPQIKAATNDFAGALHEARQASVQLPAVTEQVQRGVAAIERMAEDLTKTSGALRQVIGRNGSEVERFTNQTLPEVDALVSELRRTAEQARRLLAELRRQPQSLLYGAPRRPPGPGEARRP
jgi:phospholipid/cholesterol/gamma-HCH transport system substrate-binding protein